MRINERNWLKRGEREEAVYRASGLEFARPADREPDRVRRQAVLSEFGLVVYLQTTSVLRVQGIAGGSSLLAFIRLL